VGLITTLRCSIKLYGGAGVSPLKSTLTRRSSAGPLPTGIGTAQAEVVSAMASATLKRRMAASICLFPFFSQKPVSNASTNRAIAERWWKVSRLTYATSTRCTSTVSYFDVCTHPSSRLCRARPQFAAPRYSSNFSMRCWTANGRRRKHSRGLDQPQPAATVHSYIIQVETASCCRATPRTPQPRLYFLAHPTRRQS